MATSAAGCWGTPPGRCGPRTKLSGLQLQGGKLAARALAALAASFLAKAAAWAPCARPCTRSGLQGCSVGGPPWPRCLATRTAVGGRTAELVQSPAPAAVTAELVAQVAEAAEGRASTLGKQLVSLRNQLRDPAEAEEWLNKGNSLLGLPRGQWRRGLKQVDVPDYTQLDPSGMPVTMRVELDPDKDFQENAKLCFKQARKITRGTEKLTPLIQESEESQRRWQAEAAKAAAWKQELAAGDALSAESNDGLQQLYEAMIEENIIKRPPPPAPPADPEEEARVAFKRKYGKDIDCFRSPGGHEVVVGRSSKTNEYVSLKLAKGDMVWFHTDDRIPGSHVLIRASWDTVAEEDIEFAAKIAAHHSKAKDSLLAPVMYCQGHQVRKMKGAPLGAVSITGNAKQILVKPGLPDED